jgi:hypothetical protein
MLEAAEDGASKLKRLKLPRSQSNLYDSLVESLVSVIEQQPDSLSTFAGLKMHEFS